MRGKKKFINNRTKTVHSLVGPVSIERAYYYCYSCGESRIPLDKQLDIQNTIFSPAVRENAVIIAADISFRKSEKMLSKLSGISISAERIAAITETLGQGIEQQNLHNESAYLHHESDDADTPSPEYLYISPDGTTINTLEGWKEVKNGAVFHAEDSPDGHVRGSTKYISSLKNSQEFGSRLYALARHQGYSKARQAIVIADGAKWIWNEAQFHFTNHIEIVDWYHAAQKIWDIGKILHPGNDTLKNAWVHPRIKYLKAGNIPRLLSSLNQIHSSSPDVIAKSKETIGYFQNNKHRMRYNHYKKQGFFIGSGVVESSCKHVVAERLKKSGMKWSIQKANAVLQLRTCILNDSWDNFWVNRRKFC